jgi:peptidoglycan/xylan/chitin deacetylase (PgdA/CDA1 family)
MDRVARSTALRQLVKHGAAAVDRVRRPAPGVVVLIYHRVGARTPVEVDLPVELFDEQMAALAEERRVLTIDEALVRLDAPPGDPDEPDPVVVTFDDGTADFVDVALPVLERHRVPATLYLATGFVDDGRSFPDDGTPVSWAGLRDAVATDLVTVGSHTHTHALLDRLAPDLAADELDRSMARIEDELDRPARHFAYPKAVAPSAETDGAVRARFASAALAGSRPNAYGRTDAHRLARTPIQVSDGMAFFARKAAGGMAAEDWLRQVLNRRRYATADR